VVVVNTSRGDALVDEEFRQGDALPALTEEFGATGVPFEVRQPVRGRDVGDERSRRPQCLPMPEVAWVSRPPTCGNGDRAHLVDIVAMAIPGRSMAVRELFRPFEKTRAGPRIHLKV
jgi:hypothetical protein